MSDASSIQGPTIAGAYLRWFRPLAPLACAVAFALSWLVADDRFLLRIVACLGVSVAAALLYIAALRRYQVERVLAVSIFVDIAIIALLVAQVPDPGVAALAFVWSIALAAMFLGTLPASIASIVAAVAASAVCLAGDVPPSEVFTEAVILLVVAGAMIFVRERERRSTARVAALSFQLEQAERLARVGSWTWHVDDGEVLCSPHMYELFGLPHGSRVDVDSLVNVIAEADRDAVREAMSIALRDGTPYDLTMNLGGPGEEQRVLHVVGRLTSERGVRTMVGSAADVTEQTRLHELRQRFMATASHELRTPTTVVLGFAETIEDRWDTLGDDQRRSFLGLIANSARQLSRLIEDLLLVTRIEAGAPTMQIGELELSAELTKQAGTLPVSVDLELPEGPVLVRADEIRVAQVVANLVTNAMRYAPGSPISLRLQAEPDRNVATISVSDEGPGISTADQERIFEQFVRLDPAGASPHGSGLGLYICRQLVEAMGGKISLDSAPGAGCTFAFTLPLAR